MFFDYNEIIDIILEKRMILLSIKNKMQFDQIKPGKWPTERMVVMGEDEFEVFLYSYQKRAKKNSDPYSRYEDYEVRGENGLFSFEKYIKIIKARAEEGDIV